MARSTPRLCARCGTIVTGKCPRCSVGWNDRKHTAWQGAGSSHRRWRRPCAQKLAATPLCEWLGCRSLATTVDHVDGTDYATERYDFDKLRSLCEPHHRSALQPKGMTWGRDVRITTPHPRGDPLRRSPVHHRQSASCEEGGGRRGGITRPPQARPAPRGGPRCPRGECCRGRACMAPSKPSEVEVDPALSALSLPRVR